MKKVPKLTTSIILVVFLSIACNPKNQNTISKNLVFQKWNTITLDFQGPTLSETAEDNPFLHYRLVRRKPVPPKEAPGG